VHELGDAVIVLLFTIHGLIGSFLATLLKARKVKDLAKFCAVRNYVVGALAGYIYYYIHYDYNVPNGFLAIVFGYFSKDIIESLFERMKKRITS
jgi:hypothetical protein